MYDPALKGRIRMRKATLTLLALLLLAVSIEVEGKTGFSGTYTINGLNPGVGAYNGTLTIKPHGQVYDVAWSIANAHYSGVGIVVNDTLSVAYTAADRSWLGVMAYRQRADGSLEGRWAVQGRAGAPGTETAVRK
jgi:hypothetical protein